MSQAIGNIQLRVNANGGLYDNGRALPSLLRERILDLSHQGLGQRAIAREVRTSHTFVKKVTSSCNGTNSSIHTPRTNFPEPKIDANVLEYIEVQKRIKPSTYASEIQQRLLLDGVVHSLTFQERHRSIGDSDKTSCLVRRNWRYVHFKQKSQVHWKGKTNIYKPYQDIQPVRFISLMNQVL